MTTQVARDESNSILRKTRTILSV